MHGGRPQLLHDRVPMLISFERDRLREFEEQCSNAKISVSEGVRQLVEQELEKKELGESQGANPCNLRYTVNTEKPLQSDLRQWIDRKEAIRMARTMNLSPQQWHSIKDNVVIIDRKVTTGYLHVD